MSDSPKDGQEAAGAPADQREQRLIKYRRLVEAGRDPYGQRVDGLTSTVAARTAFETNGEGDGTAEIRVSLAGRVMAIRRMGKSIFADLRDQTPLRLEFVVEGAFEQNPEVIPDRRFACPH